MFGRLRYVVVAFVFVAAALAQEDGVQPRGRRGGGPGGQDAPIRGRGFSLLPAAQRLAEELDLNETQRTQFDEILARHRAQLEPAAEDRGKWRALRDATEAGDRARADQIRKEMAEANAGRLEAFRSLVAEVEPILDENQRWTLEEASERTLRRAEMASQGMDMALLIQRLPEELELTPEQRARYDELVQARREGMRERIGPNSERRRLFEELRAAREAGDNERVAQLEAELEELRPPPGERGPAGPGDFFAQLEPILTEQQKARLATLRPPPARSFTSIAAVLRAANRVDLHREQREVVKRLGREAQAASGQAGKTRGDEHAEIANKLKKDITDILTPEQKPKFEQELQRLSRPRDAERGAGRRGEPMRPADAPPPPPNESGAE